MDTNLEMASGEEVKLLGGWPSPYVMRPRIALNLKGVKYEFMQETLNNKSELLLKSNPVYKKIPVLIHNGNPICESMVIVQHVDDVWASTGSAILPANAYCRAIARFWTFYIDDTLLPAIREIVMGQMEESTTEAADQLTAGMQLLEEAFEKCSKGKSFFGGDTIGYLDIALGSQLGWIRVVGKMSGIEFVDEQKTPLLAGWAQRFCSDAAVKEVMPDTDKLIEFAISAYGKFKTIPPAAK